jgi:hypothetical protein
MSTPLHTRETREVAPIRGPVAPPAALPSLHDDPQKIHRLLDLLALPPGTEVRVTIVAASVIVR